MRRTLNILRNDVAKDVESLTLLAIAPVPFFLRRSITMNAGVSMRKMMKLIRGTTGPNNGPADETSPNELITKTNPDTIALTFRNERSDSINILDFTSLPPIQTRNASKTSGKEIGRRFAWWANGGPMRSPACDGFCARWLLSTERSVQTAEFGPVFFLVLVRNRRTWYLCGDGLSQFRFFFLGFPFVWHGVPPSLVVKGQKPTDSLLVVALGCIWFLFRI